MLLCWKQGHVLVVESTAWILVSEDWYRYICRFSFVPHQPNLLCAWVTGIGAIYMEKLTMKEVIADCQRVLEMTMKMNIPTPMDALRSQWVSDPFSKGCYSYLSVKCDEKGLNNLDIAVPVCITSECGQHPVLLFGGEATHPHFFSTVHGAYETGIREADRIFFHYHNLHEACPQIASLPKSLVRKTHVAIIGAGASGLSCAQRLASAGLTDFVILEAHDRIGGRIYTVPCEFSVLELGAQWIHGEDGNPLYEYCSQHNLLMDPKSDSTCEAKGLFFTSDGRIIPEDIVDEVMLKLQEIKEAVSSNQDSPTFCQSMKEVFQSGFEKYLSMCNDTPDQYSWKKGIFNFFLRFEVIDNACDSLQDITPLGYAAWAECPGQFYTCFKNGFSSFLDCLLKEIPVASVMMSKPVKCVYWTTNSSSLCTKDLDFPVLVACHDGDWVAAQHVVVTPSIGFLQQNMESFFSPCLPKHKMTAFTETGFGTISKIYLLFPKSFWKEDELGFQLVWLDGANEKEQFSTPETSWVHGITGFDRVFNQPNVLVTWVGGPYAKQVEEVPDEVVGRTCVNLLRVFIKDRDIPFPLKVIRFCWFNDEYIRGAYSCRTKQFFEAGCSVKDLSEPLLCSYTLKNGRTVQSPVVLFAGEAMDKEYFSAVHGALRSGWTEADRIIQFSNDLKKMKS